MVPFIYVVIFVMMIPVRYQETFEYEVAEHEMEAAEFIEEYAQKYMNEEDIDSWEAPEDLPIL